MCGYIYFEVLWLRDWCLCSALQSTHATTLIELGKWPIYYFCRQINFHIPNKNKLNIYLIPYTLHIFKKKNSIIFTYLPEGTFLVTNIFFLHRGTIQKIQMQWLTYIGFYSLVCVDWLRLMKTQTDRQGHSVLPRAPKNTIYNPYFWFPFASCW